MGRAKIIITTKVILIEESSYWLHSNNYILSELKFFVITQSPRCRFTRYTIGYLLKEVSSLLLKDVEIFKKGVKKGKGGSQI
ncbi:hypothetical protein SAMN05878482_11071 [Peribacillus simplex]|uniref:Uncharacterized protein n=1 Tax=Peribacillus simplex TaxID=1478 RepID=A0A9X8WMZ8_9BACI|nr:hypothetical protein SAMN05878482_11071 [Peribacillus simplex]